MATYDYLKTNITHILRFVFDSADDFGAFESVLNSYLRKPNNPVKKKTHLDALFREVYIRGIIQRNKTRNVHDLDDISNILSSVVTSLSNAEKIDRSPNTSAISKARFLSIPHSVLTSRASAISVHR